MICLLFCKVMVQGIIDNTAILTYATKANADGHTPLHQSIMAADDGVVASFINFLDEVL